MPEITLRQIAIFHAVMTTGNLTEAAALLHTSQPTISRELARFEKLLQMPLFDRIRGRLRPTAQGLQLFEEVQRSYYGLERIMDAAANIRHFQQAQLSVACLPAFSQSLLPGVCRAFLSRHDNVSLSIIPQESPLLEEWLSAQRYDLGLTENTHTPPGTERHTLAVFNEVCVIPQEHALAQKTHLTPQDFHQQRYVSLSTSDSYRHTLDAIFLGAGVNRQMIAETHSAASICALVKHGVGVSIVNPLTALDFVGSGLVLRRFSIDVPFTVSLILPKHRPSSCLIDDFVRHLRDYMAEIEARLRATLAG